MCQGTEKLTKRELQVLDLLVAGKSNKQIALVLRIAFSTAKGYVQEVLRLLEVDTRAEAAVRRERCPHRRGEGGERGDEPEP